MRTRWSFGEGNINSCTILAFNECCEGCFVIYKNGEANQMKIGIVGLPNVGKSTLFNSITKAGAECANYPFCTIEPNVGVVAVPDERLEKLARNV